MINTLNLPLLITKRDASGSGSQQDTDLPAPSTKTFNEDQCCHERLLKHVEIKIVDRTEEKYTCSHQYLQPNGTR